MHANKNKIRKNQGFQAKKVREQKIEKKDILCRLTISSQLITITNIFHFGLPLNLKG
jgi:hypothetical protein